MLTERQYMIVTLVPEGHKPCLEYPRRNEGRIIGEWRWSGPAIACASDQTSSGSSICLDSPGSRTVLPRPVPRVGVEPRHLIILEYEGREDRRGSWSRITRLDIAIWGYIGQLEGRGVVRDRGGASLGAEAGASRGRGHAGSRRLHTSDASLWPMQWSRVRRLASNQDCRADVLDV